MQSGLHWLIAIFNRTQRETFLNHLRSHEYRTEQTLKTYAHVLKKAIDFFETLIASPPKNLHAFSKSEVLKLWLIALRKKSYQRATLELSLCVLRRFLKWYAIKTQTSLIVLNFSVPKQHKPLPQVLNSEQILQLLSFSTDTPVRLRDNLMLDLFYSCGLRIDELRTLKCSALLSGGKILKIKGKGGKERLVPIGTRVQKKIAGWLEFFGDKKCPSDILISLTKRPMAMRSIQKRVAHWGEVQLGQHLHPHVLRHTFATHFLKSTGNIRAVQELLGHQHIATTQVYTHMDMSYLTKVYDAAHPKQNSCCLGREKDQDAHSRH